MQHCSLNPYNNQNPYFCQTQNRKRNLFKLLSQTFLMTTEVRIWHEQAIADMHTAEATLKEQRYYVSVFFCQQAVEKVKSLFSQKNTPSTVTRDVQPFSDIPG